MTGRTLVLGLGNTILGDDGVGIHVAREIRRRYSPADPSVEVVEASLGGLVLLDLIAGFDRVLVVDAIITTGETPAGTLHRLSLDDLGDLVNPYASHSLDLKTTIALGRSLGYEMPDEILIYAVEIKENRVFTEVLSPEVRGVVQPLAKEMIGSLPATGNC